MRHVKLGTLVKLSEFPGDFVDSVRLYFDHVLRIRAILPRYYILETLNKECISNNDGTGPGYFTRQHFTVLSAIDVARLKLSENI